jgi:hypothetical protein
MNESGQLTASDLCSMFEEAEEATLEARSASEMCRDYVDNKQLTSTEKEALRKRRQPEVITNRIKRKVDYLRGYEISQRVQPVAMPRTPKHEQDADSVRDVLRYVTDEERFDSKRSLVFDNLVVEGMAGYRVGIRETRDGIDVTIDRVPWNRMFYDPHSGERDFADAGYLGLVRWEDYDEAVRQYPDGGDALETTLQGATASDTYDDTPKHLVWADRKRRRVRICQIWIKRGDDWYFAEFTKGGILSAGPSPHVDDKGNSDCELIFGSAYVSRDNERYGLVQEMISPQDEINKRRSKSLHLLNTNQTTYEDGAIQDVEKFRQEAARPDGMMKINVGYADKVKTETRLDLAAGHMQLLQEAKNEIDMMAGNIALQGNALQKSAASGRAIIASQQGGAMEIAPIMDALRDLDLRVFRAVWNRIRQYWTGEKWIRVTDDERNVKWLVVNADPAQIQMMAEQNPDAADKIAGVIGSIAELDVDIIIDEAPDGITPQMEQFQSLVELKKMDANGELPFRAILMAMPNLRGKEKILSIMDEARQKSPEQQQLAQFSQQLQLEGAKAKVRDMNAAASHKEAQAAKAMSEANGAQQPMQMDEGSAAFDQQMQYAETAAGVEKTRADIDKTRAETAKIMQDMAMEPVRMAQQARHAQQKAQSLNTNRVASNNV